MKRKDMKTMVPVKILLGSDRSRMEDAYIIDKDSGWGYVPGRNENPLQFTLPNGVTVHSTRLRAEFGGPTAGSKVLVAYETIHGWSMTTILPRYVLSLEEAEQRQEERRQRNEEARAEAEKRREETRQRMLDAEWLLSELRRLTGLDEDSFFLPYGGGLNVLPGQTAELASRLERLQRP